MCMFFELIADYKDYYCFLFLERLINSITSFLSQSSQICLKDLRMRLVLSLPFWMLMLCGV